MEDFLKTKVEAKTAKEARKRKSINPINASVALKSEEFKVVRQRFVRYVIMFATDGTERDPVAVYKLFAGKRPKEINLDDATWP